MRAFFGALSLLVVLAVVGLLVKSQLGAIGHTVSSAAPGAVLPASGTVHEQSQQLQQRVKDDVTKALEQGAARSDEQAK